MFLWVFMDVHSYCHTEEENVDRLDGRYLSPVLMPPYQLFIEFLLYANFWKYSSEEKCVL